MATADVEAPVVETLIAIAGARTRAGSRTSPSRESRLRTPITACTVAGSHGKATVQGATVYVAYGDGNWHNSKYEITDTLPGMITVNSADTISLVGNTIKHSGSEGISMINDVVNSTVVGNYITDIAGSGITVGHPQHVYLGDTAPTRSTLPAWKGSARTIRSPTTSSTTSARSPGSGPRRHHGVLRERPQHHEQLHQQDRLQRHQPRLGMAELQGLDHLQEQLGEQQSFRQHAQPPA